MDSYEIERKAVSVFTAALDFWLVREQAPDVHIDYVVEVRRNSEPTGLNFAVQLKGTTKPKYINQKEKLSFSLKVKHLKYYLEQSKLPVYIVVVDVITGKGYWLFLQKWLKESAPSGWKQRKKINVRIPLQNELNNNNKLLESVEASDLFMRELNPSSIAASVALVHQKCIETDPNCNYEISCINGKPHIAVSPLNDSPVSLSSPNKTKLSKLFKTGEPVLFNSKEISLEGVDFFKQLFSQEERLVTLQVKQGFTCRIKLTFIKGNNKTHYTFQAKASGGSEKVNFIFQDEINPISINGTIRHSIAEKRIKGRLQLSIDINKWVGKRINQLPDSDLVFCFLEAFDNTESPVIVDVEINGSNLLNYTLDKNLLDEVMYNTQGAIAIIEKTNFVCEKLGVNPILPPLESISVEQVDMINNLWELLTNENQLIQDLSSDATLTTSLKEGSNLLNELKNIETSSSTELITKSLLNMFGERIRGWELEVKWSGFRPSLDSIKEIRSNIEQKQELCELIWLPTEGACVASSLNKVET